MLGAGHKNTIHQGSYVEGRSAWLLLACTAHCWAFLMWLCALTRPLLQSLLPTPLCCAGATRPSSCFTVARSFVMASFQQKALVLTPGHPGQPSPTLCTPAASAWPRAFLA